MERSSLATRLRPSLAQPWLDAFAEFGVIPAGFKAIDLVEWRRRARRPSRLVLLARGREAVSRLAS